MIEENIEFTVNQGVFYNSHMKYCRDISSLVISSINEDLNVLDGFCASGIRGIRYLVENNSVKNLISLDISSKAITNTNENFNKLNLKNAISFKNDFSKFLLSNDFVDKDINFIEIDPFGSPAPFIFDSIKALRNKKRAYLSVTATDVAVLCGAHKNACIKNYNSIPLNNYSRHENAIRILIGFILKIATQFNFGIKVLFSISKRHYLKVILRLDFNDKCALDSFKNLGFLSFFDDFSVSEFDFFNLKNDNLKICGPLYLGPLYEEKIIENLSLKIKNDPFFSLIKEDFLSKQKSYIPVPFISKTFSKPCFKIDFLIDKLRELGFNANRTHFNPQAIKTNATYPIFSKLFLDK